MSADSDAIAAARARIATAFDPALLREAGERLISQLAGHLQSVESSRKNVLNWEAPRRNADEARAFLKEASRFPLEEKPTEPSLAAGEPDEPKPSPSLPGLQPAGYSGTRCSPERKPDTTPDKKQIPRKEVLLSRFEELIGTMLNRGHNLHDPRYVGHQVPASVPLAGLFDALGSITNQVTAIYEMSPWASACETAVIEALGEQFGLSPGTFSGTITHGGSLANTTALLTARNVVLEKSWEQGIAAVEGAPVLVSHAEAHYCIARTAGILGLGTQQVIKAALDERRRIDPQRLDDQLARLRRENRPVMAVVACACATPIGAFDPLHDIADVCRKHDVWLHVDAAHGGAACFSRRYRHLVAGLERADSFICDAHKMMFMPALCAFIFYREKRHRFETFRQEAPYLFDPSAPGLADYDGGLKTVECTRRATAYALWGIWSLFGPQLFADLVDVTFDMGRRFYELLQEADDFVPLHEPECNIVVFRHVPPALREASPEKLGAFQLELRRRVIESGAFYLVPTSKDGVAALRTTLINPLTTAEHLRQLMETLRTHGRALLSS